MPYEKGDTNLDVGLVGHSALHAPNEASGVCIPMDVTEYCIVSTLLERTAEQPRIRKVIECYTSIAVESHMHEVVVLCDDRRCFDMLVPLL